MFRHIALNGLKPKMKTKEELDAMTLDEIQNEVTTSLQAESEAYGVVYGIEDALDTLRECDEYTAEQTGKIAKIKKAAWNDVLAVTEYKTTVSDSWWKKVPKRDFLMDFLKTGKRDIDDLDESGVHLAKQIILLIDEGYGRDFLRSFLLNAIEDAEAAAATQKKEG